VSSTLSGNRPWRKRCHKTLAKESQFEYLCPAPPKLNLRCPRRQPSCFSLALRVVEEYGKLLETQLRSEASYSPVVVVVGAVVIGTESESATLVLSFFKFVARFEARPALEHTLQGVPHLPAQTGERLGNLRRLTRDPAAGDFQRLQLV